MKGITMIANIASMKSTIEKYARNIDPPFEIFLFKNHLTIGLIEHMKTNESIRKRIIETNCLPKNIIETKNNIRANSEGDKSI